MYHRRAILDLNGNYLARAFILIFLRGKQSERLRLAINFDDKFFEKLKAEYAVNLRLVAAGRVVGQYDFNALVESFDTGQRQIRAGNRGGFDLADICCDSDLVSVTQRESQTLGLWIGEYCKDIRACINREIQRRRIVDAHL